MTSLSGPAAVGQAEGDAVAAGQSAGIATERSAAVVTGLVGDGADQPGSVVDGSNGVVSLSDGQLDLADGAAEPAESSEFDPGPAWARFVPPAVALALTLWGIATPSFWRDEAATISAVQRPFGELIRMLGNVDAVHAAYYIMIWPLVQLAGPGEFIIRLPSAIAITVAAAAVAAIGRRLVSPQVGLLSGLLFALLPAVTRYAQEARSYGLVIAVASIASYLLVRAMGAEPGRRRRWLVGYGAGLAALGILNIFALLLIPAHAITIAVNYRRHVGQPGARRLVVGWLLAATAGIVAAGPLLVLGWMQRGQISWLTVNKSATGRGTLMTIDGPIVETFAVVAVVGVAFLLTLEAGRAQRKKLWPRQVVGLSVPWLFLPPVALQVGSLITPMYTPRYILMCLPAIGLLGGTALASLGRLHKAAGPVALAIIVIAGLTAQFAQRSSSGHFDDIRAIDRIVAANARPGDVVLYTNPNAESFGVAYPYGLAALPDISIARPAIPSGTLAGTTASLSVIRQRLAHAKRVWVVEINRCVPVPEVLGLSGSPVGPALLGLPFHQAQVWQEHADWLILYTHGGQFYPPLCP
jgi:mannosyltransferase